MQKTKFYNSAWFNSRWFMWLMLILIVTSPLGIILMWRNKRYKIVFRCVLSLIFFSIFYSYITPDAPEVKNKPDTVAVEKEDLEEEQEEDSTTTYDEIEETEIPEETLNTTEPVVTLSPKEQKEADEEYNKYLAESKKEERKGKYTEWVKNQFSAWDGSHVELVKQVKEAMNDPHSFEHVDTTYIEDNDYKTLTIQMKYRGKNGFGGVITNTVSAMISIDDNNLVIMANE